MTKKAFHKIQHPFMVTTLNKVHVKGMNLYITEAICDKFTANIIF